MGLWKHYYTPETLEEAFELRSQGYDFAEVP